MPAFSSITVIIVIPNAITQGTMYIPLKPFLLACLKTVGRVPNMSPIKGVPGPHSFERDIA